MVFPSFEQQPLSRSFLYCFLIAHQARYIYTYTHTRISYENICIFIEKKIKITKISDHSIKYNSTITLSAYIYIYRQLFLIMYIPTLKCFCVRLMQLNSFSENSLYIYITARRPTSFVYLFSLYILTDYYIAKRRNTKSVYNSERVSASTAPRTLHCATPLA